MLRTSRLPAVVAVLALSWSGVTAAAQASNNDPVLICHGTASETNPYVVISVDEHAVTGHFNGTAPGHGKNNHPDLLANPDGSCGDGEEGGGDE